MPTKKMQNQIFQSFVKFMHGKKTKKKQQIWDIYVYN